MSETPPVQSNVGYVAALPGWFVLSYHRIAGKLAGYEVQRHPIVAWVINCGDEEYEDNVYPITLPRSETDLDSVCTTVLSPDGLTQRLGDNRPLSEADWLADAIERFPPARLP